MKVSQARKAQNKEAILKAAGELFREKGFDAVGVAEVMQAAGFTHGGFYGHFGSKDDLIGEALDYALRPSSRGLDFATYLDLYLSPSHRDDLRTGCAMASLATATSRQAPEVRRTFTAALRRRLESLADMIGGRRASERRRKAIGSWSAMVGAVILARATDDPELADEILAETRAWVAEHA